MTSLEKILKEYYESKQEIDRMLCNKDVLSITLGEPQLKELNKITFSKLNTLKADLLDQYESHVIKLTSLTDEISKTDDINEINILSDKCKYIRACINSIKSDIYSIDSYLKNGMEENNTEKLLVDKTKDLKNNSSILEKSGNQIITFNDDSFAYKEPTNKPELVINTTLDLLDNIDSLHVDDSSSRFISDSNHKNPVETSIAQIHLYNGKYISQSDFNSSVKSFAFKNKDNKVVLGGTEYALNTKDLDKCLNKLNNCSSLYVDNDGMLYATKKDEFEPLNITTDYAPGRYISVIDAAKAIDDMIVESPVDEIEREKIKSLSNHIRNIEK